MYVVTLNTVEEGQSPTVTLDRAFITKVPAEVAANLALLGLDGVPEETWEKKAEADSKAEAASPLKKQSSMSKIKQSCTVC